MILYDLQVKTKGMPESHSTRNYFWLKANEVNDMVSISREAFAKEHDPLTGGKYTEGDISYEWKARGDGSDQPMEKWAKGSFDKGLAVRSFYSCISCGNEGMNHSKDLGHCEACYAPIPKHAGFKTSAKKLVKLSKHVKKLAKEDEILAKEPATQLPTSDTADSAPAHLEQAGHEGCDPSKPEERMHSGSEKTYWCLSCGKDVDPVKSVQCKHDGHNVQLIDKLDGTRASLSKFDK